MHALINIAITAARNASKIITRSLDQFESSRTNNVERNKLAINVENTATKEIINTIEKSYPQHKILTAEQQGDYSKDDYIWIIDPIDGFINYTHAFPHFATSIAVKYKNKLEHAVIYDSVRQDLFRTSRGEGAYLNDHRIRVSQHKQAEGALLGTGFSSKEIQHLRPYLDSFTEIFPLVEGIRKSGSSALDLAYVAAGRLEGFWEFNLSEWHMAAGVLLIKEAGGLVGDFLGEENYLASGNIVAGNPKIFKLILQALQHSLNK